MGKKKATKKPAQVRKTCKKCGKKFKTKSGYVSHIHSSSACSDFKMRMERKEFKNSLEFKIVKDAANKLPAICKWTISAEPLYSAPSCKNATWVGVITIVMRNNRLTATLNGQRMSMHAGIFWRDDQEISFHVPLADPDFFDKFRASILEHFGRVLLKQIRNGQRRLNNDKATLAEVKRVLDEKA